MVDSHIQISSNLINQLTTNQNKPKKKNRKIKPKATHKPKGPQGSTTSIHSQPESSLYTGWPVHPPTYLPPPSSPSPEINEKLEAIKSILRDSENVLEKLEKQDATMTRELAQKAKELTDKEFKLPYQNPVPCVAEKEACLECYKKYAKDPLHCSQAVKSFAECVRLSRSAPEK